MTISRPLPWWWMAVWLSVLLAACGKPAPEASKPGTTPAAAPVLLLGPEDLLTVRAGGVLAGGPVVTGSVQPERRADLRAEVAAVVTQVLKDNGEPVRRGDLLMRLDDTAIRESLQSAEAGQRAAQQAFEQAERQVARLKTLQAQGMSSVQAVDDAEGRRNAAQSELVAARARVVSAQQQLRRTEVRAPFDGVVSDRKASVGDTSQIGKELLKVIDPSSMRFEGLVSADRVGDLKVGQRVAFRINGFGDAEFAGVLRRIDASANATTRQVEVRVAFADPTKAPRVAGLYAEGRIEAGSGPGAPALPDSALVRQEGKTQVWLVKDRALALATVTLGPRDERSGEFPVTAGLADGDRVLRYPRGTLAAGQKVEFAQAPASAPAASK